MILDGMNKAQSSLEYLLTYGWALILVSSLITVLVFAVGSPDKLVSFNSSDPRSLMVRSGYIRDGYAVMKLQNVTGGEIKINSISAMGYVGCTVNGEEANGITIGSGGEILIECTALGTGNKTITINYTDRFGFNQETNINGGGSGTNNPAAVGESVCDNDFDDDGDSLIDCADPNCHGSQGTEGTCEYGTETTCNDLFDNDADGYTDEGDSDCGACAVECSFDSDCPDPDPNPIISATCMNPGQCDSHCQSYIANFATGSNCQSLCQTRLGTACDFVGVGKNAPGSAYYYGPIGAGGFALGSTIEGTLQEIGMGNFIMIPPQTCQIKTSGMECQTIMQNQGHWCPYFPYPAMWTYCFCQ